MQTQALRSNFGHEKWRRFRLSRRRGFALIVVLTLMTLLAALSLGFLGLSSIALRSGGTQESAYQARANAKLALMLAIGELQKTAGTDRAITAPASIVNERNPMGVTGVWKSWDAGPAGARTKASRDQRFLGWLLSTPDGRVPTSPSDLSLATPGSTGAITLLGDGSLGNRANFKRDDQRITIPMTTMSVNNSNSAYAWAVLDEGVKSRAEIYSKSDNPVTTQSVLNVGAPPTDGIKALEKMDKFNPTELDSGRLISTGNFGLAQGMSKEDASAYSPDLTVYSRSLLTDPINGGFKKDMSLWFSRGLTPAQAKLPLYKNQGVITANTPSDPLMGLLASYHNLYTKLGQVGNNATAPPPMGIGMNIPASYTLPAVSANGTVVPVAPDEQMLVPTVVRIDMIFSLVCRDVHGNNTGRNGARAAGRRMVHLQYLPVVTLHNPYNVPLAFDTMKVTLRDLPIGFQIFINGRQTRDQLTPLGRLYVNSGSGSKSFGMTLTKSLGAATGMTLEPGQTKLFGTPKVEPTWRWDDEQAGGNGDGIKLFDHRNTYTNDFQLVPKLMSAPYAGGGFDVDWLAPDPGRSTDTALTSNFTVWNEGLVAALPSDIITVKFGPVMGINNFFSADIVVNQKNDPTKAKQIGAFSVKYGDLNQLTKLLQAGKSDRFPDARVFPETYPKAGDKPMTGESIYEIGSRAIKDYEKSRAFAIFSLAGKTTRESFVPTRTIADTSPVVNVAGMDLTTGKDPLGAVPMEMVLMPIRAGVGAIEGIRDTEEAYFFGGNGVTRGTPRATFYEVPLAPLQSIAQLRHANLAGSGAMPRVTYTVGESRAHPLIGTGTTSRNWTDNSLMLDHTFLANEALWDAYFFSTIADQTAPLFSGPQVKSNTALMEDFFQGDTRLSNQRIAPFNAGSSKPPADIATANDAYLRSAAFLAVIGGFNVNSTSEDAWVAVLSGLRGMQLETNAGTDTGMGTRSPFPRVRRPSAKGIDSMALVTRQAAWEGYRSLSDTEVRDLAKDITREIRKRGPFLSLSDFVNRGIGPASDEINIKGAIQAAIDHTTSINQKTASDGIELDPTQLALNGYPSPEVGVGNSFAGGPGQISQGDVLSAIGSRITVRSDTFRIRAYGESRDSTGNKVLSRAWCEAVVQRTPSFVDPTFAATTTPASAGPVNNRFGRRFEIVQFRWLTKDEV